MFCFVTNEPEGCGINVLEVNENGALVSREVTVFTKGVPREVALDHANKAHGYTILGQSFGDAYSKLCDNVQVQHTLAGLLGSKTDRYTLICEFVKKNGKW